MNAIAVIAAGLWFGLVQSHSVTFLLTDLSAQTLPLSRSSQDWTRPPRAPVEDYT